MVSFQENLGDDAHAENDATAFRSLVEMLERSGAPFVIHYHAVMRTVEEAERTLTFDVARIMKTVAFRTRSGVLVLAALRGTSRVDYPRLAALIDVNRRDLYPLSPEEVRERLGVKAGSVSPLPLRKDITILIDDDVLTILPTVYCGIGRPDRTLEMAPDDLVKLSGGRVGTFSRQ
jgi:Cys-tRNA(Pro)/Cys-tRNA(Cys) deacylase